MPVLNNQRPKASLMGSEEVADTFDLGEGRCVLWGKSYLCRREH